MPQHSDTNGSAWYRARRSNLAVVWVVAVTLFTDMLVYGVVIPCLPRIVIDRIKGDSTMIGFLFGCYAFGLLVATPIFAVISDRYQNRRYPMMGGMLGLIASTLAFGAADTYLLLVLARIAQGVAGGASWTIGLGMLADVFPTKRLGVVMGAVYTAHTVGFAIGPAVGGFLFEYGGFSTPFNFCAGFALINFFAILFLAEPEHKKDAEKLYDHTTPGQGDEDGLATLVDEATPLMVKPAAVVEPQTINMLSLIKNWRVLSCILCVIVSASVFAGIEPALPIHLQREYGASTAMCGYLFVAMVIPSFLAAVVGDLSDKIGRQVISASGMLMMAFAAPLVALRYSSIYWIIPPLMLFGLSNPVTLTPILPEMGETMSDLGGNAYAQVYALYNMAYSIGMFIGPVVAGFLMTHTSFETLMIFFSVSLIACTPVMMDCFTLCRKLISLMRRHE